MTVAKAGIVAVVLLCPGIAEARPADEEAVAARHRLRDLGPAPHGTGEHDPVMTLQRRTVRPAGATMAAYRGGPGTSSFDAAPLSRTTLLRFEDRIDLDDRLAATIGWRGLKVSNRNANAALGGRATRLRARDWFLPDGVLAYRPTPRLGLSLGYREAMRAFEGAGTIGALGLTQADFVTLRETLRPERSQLVRIDGDWQLHDVRFALAGFGGGLRFPLDLSSRSYRPGNGGSLTLSGVEMSVEQKLRAGVTLSGAYRRADGRATGGGGAFREQEVGIRGNWNDGPWHGAFGAYRAASTLRDPRPAPAATRIEAAVAYRMTGPAGRPLQLSGRLIDPSGLASARVMEPNGAVRADDRARRVVFQASMAW